METTMCLPKSLDLTRLRIYAPYIRTLEVSELPRKLYKVKGDWPVFNSTAKPGLLPNLHNLSITSTSKVATPDEINWLSLLLCPSLRSIRMKSWYLHRRLLMDVERFPTFLSDIARCCPLLETFEVYCAVGRPLNYRGITSSNYTSPNDDAHAWPETRLNFAPSFQHVRHLSGSTAFLQPGLFHSIAKLPLLESLSLYDSAPGTQFTLTDIISVPGNAFPALWQLELRHLDTYITLFLCGLEPLVRRLTSIVIEFPQSSTRDFEDHDRSHSVICSLGILAPHIANLAVYSPGQQAQLLMGNSIIEALGRLPLQSLALPEALLAPSIQWKDVLGALSGVQVLRLRCTVKYHELEAFATCLPRLRVLELRMIEFMQSNHSGFGELGAVREVGASVCLEGEVYIEGMKDDIMREAARVGI
ncbi:hypothetical protein FS749_008114 [Ceratobasidium sp. UAMH 11750]|nr:hypothetical protein FS749_008114 [Ceratobasidium sp. UAMH 11750]